VGLGVDLMVPLTIVLPGAVLLLLAGAVIGRTFEQRRRARRARLLADLEREYTRETYRDSDHWAGRAAAASHYQEGETTAGGTAVPRDTGEQSTPR
jgi:hypothetical protein